MKHSLILLTAILLVLSGCRTKSNVEDVWGYIQERPDSALHVLEGIDTLQLHSASLRAQYSLLYTMALDKNYIDTSDFRLILPALAYYENHGNANGKMLSDYYAGRLCEE